MSAAAGAPQPADQPPPGPSRTAPQDRPDDLPNEVDQCWTKDEKTKTCKCEPCGDRVRSWSYKCSKCNRHVCSECLDHHSSKTAWQKATARDRVYKGCWCRFRSNMNPDFRDWKPTPPVRTDEEQKARELKSLVALKKAAKTSKSETPSTSSGSDTAPSARDGSIAFPRTDEQYQEEGEGGQSAIAKVRSKRSGIKRKAYRENDSDNELPQDDTPIETDQRSKKKLKTANVESYGVRIQESASIQLVLDEQRQHEMGKATDSAQKDHRLLDGSHLNDGSTVIMGAGFTGLSIARELALEVQKANVKHSITVVDVRAEYCELASGHCLGVLSTHGMPEQCGSIAEVAQSCWRDILSADASRQELQFKPQSVYNIQSDDVIDHDITPSWLEGTHQLSIMEDSLAIGKINSATLAFWLYEQCELLGVAFRFNHAVFSAQFARDSSVEAVTIENVKRPEQAAVKLPCRNLVIAAGPYSTWILQDLFKHQLLDLENHVQRAQWFRATRQGLTADDDVVLHISTKPVEDSLIESEISMLAQSEKDCVTVFGMTSKVNDLNLTHIDARQNSKPRATELRDVASEYLNSEDLDVVAKANLIETGCADLSTANNGNPIIDKVPASALGQLTTEEQDANPCGVWLCYGFGRHGTMLAPGAARMLVQKMVKGSCEADCYDISIPLYNKPKPEDKGKGKGKAKA